MIDAARNMADDSGCRTSVLENICNVHEAVVEDVMAIDLVVYRH